MADTKSMEERVEDGFYLGRRIIERDSPIDGGIFLGEGQRPAIVVDSEKYPAIGTLYEKAKKKALVGLVENHVTKGLVLNAVYDTVKQTMTFNDDHSVETLLMFMHCGKDGKVSLDAFIDNKIGQDEHMALACGVLLELFRKDGFISGKPSIDSNEGHAWCRYTNSGGEVYILDVAQNYIGRMKKAINRDYRRSTDN